MRRKRRSDHLRPLSTDREEYEKFGNAETRNGLQARVEVPLLLRALRLPQGGRVLEIGCGRGVALPVLADGRFLASAWAWTSTRRSSRQTSATCPSSRAASTS